MKASKTSKSILNLRQTEKRKGAIKFLIQHPFSTRRSSFHNPLLECFMDHWIPFVAHLASPPNLFLQEPCMVVNQLTHNRKEHLQFSKRLEDFFANFALVL